MISPAFRHSFTVASPGVYVGGEGIFIKVSPSGEAKKVAGQIQISLIRQGSEEVGAPVSHGWRRYCRIQIES